MFKKVSLLLVAIIIVISLPLTAVAAGETKELFTIDSSYNMAVSVLFDNEMPDVSFIAPNGKVIEGISLQYDSGDDWIQFYIPNAMAGTWAITYDKKSNTQLEINYSSYMNPIAISEFIFDSVNNGRISAHFVVNGEATARYQWQIYAVVSEQGSVVGEKKLTEGSAALGETITQDVYVGDLTDYSNYQLRLDVWQKDGVEEVYDSRIAEGTFSVSGNTIGEAIDDFRAELNITDGDLLVDWSEWSKYKEYILAVFDDDVSTTEPFYFTEITDGRTQVEALFDPAADSIRIELTGRSNGRNTHTKSKTIVLNNGVHFTAQTSGLTNASQVRIDYEVPQNITADITVNGKTDTINLSGTGNFSVKIPDSYNKAEIRYSMQDRNVIYIVKFDVTVDNVPPILRLPENKTAIRVDRNEYVLAGVTEADALLQIGAETVAVNADGTFVHTISLKNGENIIKVTATDRTGNITAQDVIITRVSTAGLISKGGEGGVKNFFPLIGSFIISVILLCAILLFSRGLERTDNRVLYILKSARIIVLALGALCLIVAGYFLWRYIALRNLSGDEDYFVLALKSIDEAYMVLENTNFCAQTSVYFGFGVAGCVIVAVLLGLAIKSLKKRSEKRITSTDESIDEIKSEEKNNLIDITEKPVEYICPACGTKYDKHVKFCSKCGARM